MADTNFVILLLCLITVNVLAVYHEDFEARLQVALEQSRTESEARFRELELKLNAKEEELENTRIDLQETKSDFQKAILDLQKTKSDIQETILNFQKTKSDGECLKCPVRDRRVSEPEPIAFHAELGTSATNLVANQKFIFERPLLNSGHAYNNQTGIFTCPMSGIYFFSLSILAYLGEQVETELVVNDDAADIMQTYSGSSSADRYNSGSRSVVWKLNAGDRVWTRLFNNTVVNGNSSNVNGGQWSTFTGFFVHAT